MLPFSGYSEDEQYIHTKLLGIVSTTSIILT